ncbi:hypothetical protein PoB_006857700 [Plakobranchus ocellatus]|uniref:Uncharacterized protein n=1 Tax=Plakobranchus ocellatus TaxID=259542 RepID=A0AAV4DCW2_9GAST|nr:hypothetical protein PoB_006857700 [Plakobranchus ocellatus]
MTLQNSCNMLLCVKYIQNLTFVLSLTWISLSAQLLVPVTSPGATPKPTSSSSFNPSSCNYLVSRTNGVCMVTTSAVQNQLNAIKDDSFRARLQYMSQNSVLQTQMAKLQIFIAALTATPPLLLSLQLLPLQPLSTPAVASDPNISTITFLPYIHYHTTIMISITAASTSAAATTITIITTDNNTTLIRLRHYHHDHHHCCHHQYIITITITTTTTIAITTTQLSSAPPLPPPP